jgi:hypothetical protein
MKIMSVPFKTICRVDNGRHVTPRKTHCPDSEPINLCSFSLIEAGNTNNIVFGLTNYYTTDQSTNTG